MALGDAFGDPHAQGSANGESEVDRQVGSGSNRDYVERIRAYENGDRQFEERDPWLQGMPEAAPTVVREWEEL